MFLVGLILFAAAAAGALIGIVQNRHLVIDVHALGQIWTVHAYWVLVAGVIVAVVGLLGLGIMNRGAERSRRLRRERRALVRENRRLSKLAADNRHDIASKRAANAYPLGGGGLDGSFRSRVSVGLTSGSDPPMFQV